MTAWVKWEVCSKPHNPTNLVFEQRRVLFNSFETNNGLSCVISKTKKISSCQGLKKVVGIRMCGYNLKPQ